MDSSKTGDLLYYAEVVSNFLERGGSLSPSQYKQFWANLSDASNTTRYVLVLVTRLLALDAGDKTPLMEAVRKIASNMEPPYVTVDPKATVLETTTYVPARHNLLLTLHYLALYYQVEADDEHVKAALSQWIALLGPQLKVDGVDDLARMLSPTASKGNDTIIHLVDQCSNIEFPPSFDFTFNNFSPKLLSPSFINNFLRMSLVQNQSKLIFEAMLLFLKHPLITEKRMLALLHILKQYLIKCPQTDAEIMNSALQIVKTYYTWPRPYGDVARDVLQLLTVESKSPGSAMRKRMLQENPEMIKGVRKTGKERIVHLLVDNTSADGQTLQELLKTQAAPDISVQQLQLNVLAHCFSSILHTEIETLGLESLGKEDCVRYYEMAMQVLNEAVLMKYEDAVAHRMKELNDLLQEVTRTIKENPKSQGFLRPTPATLPPLNFQFLPISIETTDPTSCQLQTKLKYPKRSSVDVLTNIIGQYAAFADPANKPVIKIGIIGGDSILHNIVGSYMSLKASAPRSLDGLDLHFFLIPVEPSLLGGFLGTYDAWYGRHVCALPRAVIQVNPTISLPATFGSTDPSVPKSKTWSTSELEGEVGRLNSISTRQYNATAAKPMSLRVKSPTVGEPGIFHDLKQLYGENNAPPTPSLVLRSELENYMREAKWKLEINLYHCECWSQEGIYYSIPFCQRAELGLRAYARSVQLKNGIPENSSLSAIQSHKAFKWIPASISIRYTQMNVLGQPRQGTPIESKSYVSIIAANVPSHTDRGVSPNPTKPWLEMVLVEVDKKRKAKTLDKELENGNVSCLHASIVEMESDDKKKPFFILLDNTVYGPMVKIKISGCTGTGDDPIAIPFMTFLPIEMVS